MRGAVDEAWRLGINPGGEVSITEMPADVVATEWPLEWHGRLISKRELNERGEFSRYDRARMS
jgi:hypothetical protein